jgi:multimeric flavodoxin WrbA
MITILTDKTTNDLAEGLCKKIMNTRRDIRHFNLENMRIEPCYACRGCEEKTYGRCIVRDDADLILPCLARSEIIVVFTHIVFGGYSFQIKRAMDKFVLLVDRHYSYHDGELRKGKPSGIKYYAVGVHDGVYTEEIQVFKQLIRETNKIATWAGGPIVLPYDTNDYDSLIEEVAGS